jgi:hypothetical protein
MFVGIKTYKRLDALKALIKSIREYEKDVMIYVLNDDPTCKIGNEFKDWGINFYGVNVENKGSNWCNNQLMKEFIRLTDKYNYLTDFLLLDDDTLCTGPFVDLIDAEEAPHLYIPNKGAKHQMPWGYAFTGTKDLLDKIGGFDLDRFSTYGLAHVDWTWRAEEAGLAKAVQLPFKLNPAAGRSQANKAEYIKNKEKYMKRLLDRESEREIPKLFPRRIVLQEKINDK